MTNHGQVAAIAALADQHFVEASRIYNSEGLARLTEIVDSLGNHGLRAVPSKANFLLILFEGAITAEQAHAELAQAGYATRWLPGHGLPQGLRITIGTEEQMADVARTLRALVDAQ